jgi:hypothetical protein
MLSYNFSVFDIYFGAEFSGMEYIAFSGIRLMEITPDITSLGSEYESTTHVFALVY